MRPCPYALYFLYKLFGRKLTSATHSISQSVKQSPANYIICIRCSTLVSHKSGLEVIVESLGELLQKGIITINYDKTKIIVFSRKRMKYRWQMNSHKIQVSYRYLGMIQLSTGTQKLQLKNAVANIQRSLKALLSFFFKSGGQFIPFCYSSFYSKDSSSAAIWSMQNHIW